MSSPNPAYGEERDDVPTPEQVELQTWRSIIFQTPQILQVSVGGFLTFYCPKHRVLWSAKANEQLNIDNLEHLDTSMLYDARKIMALSSHDEHIQGCNEGSWEDCLGNDEGFRRWFLRNLPIEQAREVAEMLVQDNYGWHIVDAEVDSFGEITETKIFPDAEYGDASGKRYDRKPPQLYLKITGERALESALQQPDAEAAGPDGKNSPSDIESSKELDQDGPDIPDFWDPGLE